MEHRVTRLEENMVDLGNRVTAAETSLAHGAKMFERVEQGIAGNFAVLTTMQTDIKTHMDKEDSNRNKLFMWALGFLATLVVALVSYVWKIQVAE